MRSPYFICERPVVSDPLSEVIALLQPRTVFAKRISGAGRWGVRYSDFGQPSFCAVLEGSCRLAVDGHRPVTLETGDFVLLPATPGFTLSGFEPVTPERIDPKVAPAPTGGVRHGTRGGRPDVRLLGGYFVFDSPDAALLVSLLPVLVHVRGAERLSVLVRLVGEESSERRPGRELVLTRLVVCCEDWPTRVSRQRCGRCMASPGVRGRWPSLRRRPRFRVRRSSSVSRAQWVLRRWNTCSPGAWPSRRICFAATTSASPK